MSELVRGSSPKLMVGALSLALSFDLGRPWGALSVFCSRGLGAIIQPLDCTILVVAF